jgi:hypothetical protein
MATYENEQGRALIVTSLLIMLANRRAWLWEYFDEESIECLEFRGYHLDAIGRMVDLVKDITVPIDAIEYLVDKDFRNLDCVGCGSHFTPAQACILIASNGHKYQARINGNSVYGREFACCSWEQHKVQKEEKEECSCITCNVLPFSV